MKKLVVTVLFSFCAFHAAFALKFISGNDKVISKPVYDDLYITGGTLTINAPVYGDLVVAGGTITINDSITGDLAITGGNISINGYVGDDIRCAGGEIRLKGNVGGDFVIAGGKIYIDNSAVINGDVMAGAGNLLMNGTVNGNLKAGIGELDMNGSVGKNMDCRGEKIRINGSVSGKSIIAAQELNIGTTASFNSDVRYWADDKNVDFGQSVKNGKAVYDSSLVMEREHWYLLGFSAFMFAFWYLAVAFIFIVLIQYLFRTTMKTAAYKAFDSTGRSLGYGVLFFIAVPIAIVILTITIVGIPVALILLLAYIILALLTTIISSVVVANWFSNRNQRNWSNGKMSFIALLAFIVLKIVSAIPFMGWLLMFVIAAIAFGSIILSMNRKRNL